MKILWLCNVMLPKFANELNIAPQVTGGWLTGAADAISAVPDIQLHICCGQRLSKDWITRTVDGIVFHGYPASANPPHKYDSTIEEYFRQLLRQVQPDLVHIWGTEFSHSLAMAKAFDCPERTLVNIQGLCSYIAEHYMAHLTYSDRDTVTLRDVLRWDWIGMQQMRFMQRGQLEKQTLQRVKHIIGRTRWDKACIRQLAPQARYYKCNETLRGSFYTHAGSWTPESCDRHSIFVSQASYPLKGFHLVLEAMPEILKRYPDAMLYTTGTSPFQQRFYAVGGYRRVLKNKIRKLGLQDHVVFLGPLDEEKMCQRFLRSHVFVSASSIENSPNSVGEAMLLGVPTVASYVGGTMDLLTDGEDGFLYQPDAPYMLASHVCRIFADDELARKFSRNATAHAQVTHDPTENLNTLVKIYQEVNKL